MPDKLSDFVKLAIAQTKRNTLSFSAILILRASKCSLYVHSIYFSYLRCGLFINDFKLRITDIFFTLYLIYNIMIILLLDV
jgi:hypothetical protein